MQSTKEIVIQIHCQLRNYINETNFWKTGNLVNWSFDILVAKFDGVLTFKLFRGPLSKIFSNEAYDVILKHLISGVTSLEFLAQL